MIKDDNNKGVNEMKVALTKIKVDGKIAVRVNIRAYTNDDIPLLDKLGITTLETGMTNYRYKVCKTNEELNTTKTALFEACEIIEDTGTALILKRK